MNMLHFVESAARVLCVPVCMYIPISSRAEVAYKKIKHSYAVFIKKFHLLSLLAGYLPLNIWKTLFRMTFRSIPFGSVPASISTSQEWLLPLDLRMKCSSTLGFTGRRPKQKHMIQKKRRRSLKNSLLTTMGRSYICT